MKKLFLSIFLVNLICLVNSQPSKRELIREMLSLVEIGKSVAQSSIKYSPQGLESRTNNDQQIEGIIERFVNNRKEELIDSLVNIYDSLFTYDEILQLDIFFTSPGGKKYKEYLPLITFKTMVAGQNWFKSNHDILQAMFDSAYSDTGAITKKSFLYKEVDLVPDKPYKYKKRLKSRSVYTSEEFRYKIYYNDKIWKEIDPAILGSSSDKAFKMIDKEIYGMVLAESNDLNLKELRYTALYNLYKASDSYEILHNALRNINGSEVLFMQFLANVNAVSIKYHTYYYSGNSLVIQFSTFSGTDSFEENKDKMQDLLNGLVIIK